MIPGVFYGFEDGKDFKVLVMLEASVVSKEMRLRGAELENTLYNLDIKGLSKCLVVPRTVQINPRKWLDIV